ncbi:response regulator [Epidermidibacterium keratini]|uniref:Response regulator n=1 Tax=Epidermidibacterium keratini TaxID=1891644 RepID=A0A7L4YMS4_9ACTN|nr:response regulator transcription factor [Epidermidibacterium keratini]QHC00575.1 response regulator [Epidermidibacterium keratini]
MSTKVLIVDDQQMVRAGFGALLDAQADIDVVADAADGAAGVAAARSHRPDVVLMDVRMPVMDGLEATRQILAGSDPPRVVMLTTFDIDDYVYTALRLGASGFLLKDAPPADLISAVRIAAEGNALLAPTVTRRMIEQFARSQPATAPSVELNALTARELDVLRLVAKGLSNAEIAGSLVVAEQTVKTHLGRVFTKLGLRDRAQAVVYAYESRLITAGDG